MVLNTISAMNDEFFGIFMIFYFFYFKNPDFGPIPTHEKIFSFKFFSDPVKW